MSEQLTEMRLLLNNILEEDKIIEVSLKNLIWTIINYSYEMRDIEEKLFNNISDNPFECRRDDIEKREYLACRRDELARIISMYSDFDTEIMWDNISLIFK